jgi:microcompartment protein CcmL/EutN
MKADTAIAMLEFSSVAHGAAVADAMVKRAPITLFSVGTVQPGKYLVLIGGAVAAVEEAYREGLLRAGDTLNDDVFLPDAHQQVQDAIEGLRRLSDGDALGIIETSSIPANLRAADRAVKNANVSIVEIRFGDGLGGKGITHVTGALHDVQAAIEAAVASVTRPGVQTWSTVIARQHAELRARIGHSTAFHT